MKGKGEKVRYIHLKAKFQRITRRDKNIFLSEQYKEIEQNNRMGKTRDLFKKIRDIKGTFHTKMGSIKDRNGMDLTYRKIPTRVAMVGTSLMVQWLRTPYSQCQGHEFDPLLGELGSCVPG